MPLFSDSLSPKMPVISCLPSFLSPILHSFLLIYRLIPVNRLFIWRPGTFRLKTPPITKVAIDCSWVKTINLFFGFNTNCKKKALIGKLTTQLIWLKLVNRDHKVVHILLIYCDSPVGLFTLLKSLYSLFYLSPRGCLKLPGCYRAASSR